MTTATQSKPVGPVIRGVDDEIIDAVIAAAEQDNPDKEIEVEDRGGYVRVRCNQSMLITRKSLEEALGRPFQMSELEPSLVSFAGRLVTEDDQWVWSLHDAS